MEVNSSQIIKGNLEACVLKLISCKDMYGYEVTQYLTKFGLDNVAQGTIYPLLLKLEKENLITSYLKESMEGPPRKYYKITNDGLFFIEQFKTEWEKIKNSIDKILNI